MTGDFFEVSTPNVQFTTVIFFLICRTMVMPKFWLKCVTVNFKQRGGGFLFSGLLHTKVLLVSKKREEGGKFTGFFFYLFIFFFFVLIFVDGFFLFFFHPLRS